MLQRYWEEIEAKAISSEIRRTDAFEDEMRAVKDLKNMS